MTTVATGQLNFCWLLLAVLLGVLHGAHAADPTDADLLLALKESFLNGNASTAEILKSWNGTEPCSEEWEHIGCQQGRVTTM
jgi:hypothetical protein